MFSNYSHFVQNERERERERQTDRQTDRERENWKRKEEFFKIVGEHDFSSYLQKMKTVSCIYSVVT